MGCQGKRALVDGSALSRMEGFLNPRVSVPSPVQLRLRHLNPRNELTAQVSNDHWTFLYNLKNKVGMRSGGWAHHTLPPPTQASPAFPMNPSTGY